MLVVVEEFGQGRFVELVQRLAERRGGRFTGHETAAIYPAKGEDEGVAVLVAVTVVEAGSSMTRS